jgi:N-acetyl-1-D-myo-inositol-2-amino-2-deoxy-alpha-D-glucopyranoside deacetylase
MRGLARSVARSLRLPALALATVGLGYLAWLGLDGSLAGLGRPALPTLEADSLGDRLLVISPHPDDEALASGALVRQALVSGKQVKVVVVTCGDGFRRIVRGYALPKSTLSPFIRLGEARRAESVRAMSSLGLPPEDVTFLGYPDGAMASLWTADWAASRPRTGSNGFDHVPYDFALDPGAPYTGSSVTSDLASVIASFAPSTVVFPDADDANADHWAVNAFTQYALDRADFRGDRLTYLVHRGHFPFPWSYVPDGWIQPPRTLLDLGVTWYSFPLTAHAEAEKERALEAYRSQQRAMEPFIASFVRRNEIFGVFKPPGTVAPVSRISLDASSMPGVAVRDPLADTLLRAVDGGADLRQVALVRLDGDVWLGLQTQAGIAPGITYRVNVRLLRADGSVARLDVEASRGKAQALRMGPDSVFTAAPLVRHVKGSRMWIRIPGSLFSGTRECMLSAESYQGGSVLDRTAVRPVALP